MAETLSEKLGLEPAAEMADMLEGCVSVPTIALHVEVDRRATLSKLAEWLEAEAVRVEALVEANTDVRDWRETASLEAGARSLRSTLGHIRRELLEGGGDG